MGRLPWQITTLAESKGTIPKAVRVDAVLVTAVEAVGRIVAVAAEAAIACVDAVYASSAPKR